MRLTTGTRLGSYEITGSLGAGAQPSLSAVFDRSYGGSSEAKETTR